jgi:hypothetical protein
MDNADDACQIDLDAERQGDSTNESKTPNAAAGGANADA